MRQRTLLTQVLAVNTALVAVTAFVAAVVARERLNEAISTQGLLMIGLAVLAVVLLNSLLLRRRLEPMGKLVSTMSEVDLASPGMRAEVSAGASSEVQRLTADFNRMMGRLEHERRESGRAARTGAGALPDRAGPPRRGQPGADGHPAAARGDDGGRPAAPHQRARRHEGARHPGDGGAAAPRARAAPDRARRPRPRPRARLPDRRLRRAHRHPLTLPAADRPAAQA